MTTIRVQLISGKFGNNYIDVEQEDYEKALRTTIGILNNIISSYKETRNAYRATLEFHTKIPSED